MRCGAPQGNDCKYLAIVSNEVAWLLGNGVLSVGTLGELLKAGGSCRSCGSSRKVKVNFFT